MKKFNETKTFCLISIAKTSSKTNENIERMQYYSHKTKFQHETGAYHDTFPKNFKGVVREYYK